MTKVPPNGYGADSANINWATHASALAAGSALAEQGNEVVSREGMTTAEAAREKLSGNMADAQIATRSRHHASRAFGKFAGSTRSAKVMNALAAGRSLAEDQELAAKISSARPLGNIAQRVKKAGQALVMEARRYLAETAVVEERARADNERWANSGGDREVATQIVASFGAQPFYAARLALAVGKRLEEEQILWLREYGRTLTAAAKTLL